MFQTFFYKNHLQAEYILRKEHVRYSATNIERDLVLHI